MKRQYKRKLTLWYPGNIKPEADRIGPYGISLSHGKHRRGAPSFYAYWDGKQWGMTAKTPELAEQYRKEPNMNQERPWRGCTTPE